MKRIGIIAALPAEVGSLHQGKYKLNTPVEIQKDLFVCMSGMGAANASLSAIKLIEKEVDALISWGVAGAITSILQPGDLLIADEVIAEESSFFPDQHWLSNIVSSLNNAPASIHINKIASIDQVCSTIDDKKQVSEKTNAYAVDMESSAIAKIAKENGKDFLAIRAIADDAQTSLPKVVTQYTDMLGRPKWGPFIYSCLTQPGQIKDLIKLAKCYNQALLTLHQIAPDLKKQYSLYNS